MILILTVGLRTVIGKELVVPPPGAELKTVIENIPAPVMSLAGMEVVS